MAVLQKEIIDRMVTLMGETKDGILILIGLVIFLIIGSVIGRNAPDKGDIVHNLHSVSPQDVSSFWIYPKVNKPVGEPVKFIQTDSLVTEFVQAMNSVRDYFPNHDTVSLQDHSWFVEMAVKDPAKLWQIHLYIPSQRNTGVVKVMGGTSYFQSQQLYQWYQTYSHRWLTPEE